jgi:hypothetical protein
MGGPFQTRQNLSGGDKSCLVCKVEPPAVRLHLPLRERIRDDVIENAVVEIQERFGDSWAGEVLVAQRPADFGAFSESELAVLRAVKKQVGAKTSKRLSELSHAETAWITTEMGERIPYETAKGLSIPLALG